VRKKNKGEIMRQLRGEKGKEDRNNEREIERYVEIMTERKRHRG